MVNSAGALGASLKARTAVSHVAIRSTRSYRLRESAAAGGAFGKPRTRTVKGITPPFDVFLTSSNATVGQRGNRKLDKERAVWRVDGTIALAMAIGLRARDRGSAHAIDVRALIG